MDLIEALQTQARSCRSLGSPMYGSLLEAMAAEAANPDGAVRTVLAGHEDDPGPSALALRLLGSLHRLVLTGRAAPLESFYPSVGGTWDEQHGAAAVLAYLAAHPQQVREWLDRPPQTNEVGRSAALMGALLHLQDPARLPIRLFEIGSSGGLNLLLDSFTFVDSAGTRYGARDSAVIIEPAWHASDTCRPWPGLRVVHSEGCDIHPVPSGTPEGALVLRSYVWPDQPVRLQRLEGALQIAAERQPVVRQASAGDFVASISPEECALTVLWHSVMWQYLDAAEQQRVTGLLEQLGAEASDHAPVAHIRLEPSRRTSQGPHEFLVQCTTWPGGQVQVLGTAHPHGTPVTWEDAPLTP